LNSINGFPKTFTMITPSNNATGGEIIENRHKRTIATKMICCK
jgi:hypothetical protein